MSLFNQNNGFNKSSKDKHKHSYKHSSDSFLMPVVVFIIIVIAVYSIGRSISENSDSTLPLHEKVWTWIVSSFLTFGGIGIAIIIIAAIVLIIFLASEQKSKNNRW